jgi:translation initiation factor 2 subunit 2
MDISYEQMLDTAKAKLPEDGLSKDRFTVPKVLGHIEGSKTIISNFGQIADVLGRPVQHLLKYIQKELATPGEMRKNAVIFPTKLNASRINEKIQQYTDEFVICKECGKPDTKLSKDGSVYFIRCQACGARHSIASRI